MYLKSENLQKIEKLSKEIKPIETINTQVMEILFCVKTMMDDKTIDRESVKLKLDDILNLIKK